MRDKRKARLAEEYAERILLEETEGPDAGKRPTEKQVRSFATKAFSGIGLPLHDDLLRTPSNRCCRHPTAISLS